MPAPLTPSQPSDHAAPGPAASGEAGEFSDAARALVPLDRPLPALRTGLSGAELLARLDALARRGKLAGYAPIAGADPSEGRFVASAFGTPYDGRLSGRLVGGRVEFSVAIKPLLPWVFAVVLVLSVWPGVLLAESLMTTYFGRAVGSWTWWWYLPLTAPTTPWAIWWSVRRSQALIHDDAHRVIAGVATELRAAVEPGTGAARG